MIHQERRTAMEAMEEAMNVQQQMRRYESKYINQSFIAYYENRNAFSSLISMFCKYDSG